MNSLKEESSKSLAGSKDIFKNILTTQPILLILIFFLIVFSFTVPYFFSVRNFLNILRQSSVIGIVSCGLTIALITGCIDLSVGAVFSLVGVVSLSLLRTNNVLLAFLVPLLIALAVGLLNGSVITKFGTNTVIATLATLSIVRGISLLYTKGHHVDGIDNQVYQFVGKTNYFGVPVYVFLFIFIAIILGVMLNYTSFGRFIKHIGSNSSAAEIAGIKVNKIKVYAFMISAVCAAIGSIILCSRLNTASPVSGDGLEFDAITAIVVGGTSLFGGKGSIFKTVIGVFLITTLINGMTLLNVPFAYQYIIKAFLLIIAVLIDVKTRERMG